MPDEITLQSLEKYYAAGTPTEAGSAISEQQANEIDPLNAEDKAKINEIKRSIDLTDNQAMIQYGAGAQQSLAEFSDSILAELRRKDSRYVGDLLADLLAQVKSVDTDKLRGDGLMEKIPLFKSISHSLQRFTEHYRLVETQIGQIEEKLDGARMNLLKDIGLYDQLYQKNLAYFHNLELYIRAGEEKLSELRSGTLPRLRAEAAQTGDPMAMQVVSDFSASLDRFEKKLHDLKLSRMLAIQSAPQIKLIQNNDQLLVEKIQAALLHTIPLWKSQITITLGLFHQQQALGLQRKVSDAANSLLSHNAEMLKQNTEDVQRESQRGAIDLSTLQKVNKDLIDTIDESLKIQQDGRAQRAQVEAALAKLEGELKETLIRTASAAAQNATASQDSAGVADNRTGDGAEKKPDTMKDVTPQ